MQTLGRYEPLQIHHLRLNTLIRLRWLAIVGQSAAVLIVAYWLGFPLPVSLCFALIALSAWLNLFLAFRYPATHRLPPPAALAILLFDALQLAGLLYMTGGLTNPFALLMTVPVVVSATSLSARWTLLLGLAVVVMATLLVFFHLPDYRPLERRPGRLRDLALAGVFGLVVTGLVLVALSNRVDSALAPYFIANAKPLGHGGNIVNVILVDFRGIDTFGEITVLAAAGIGVFALLRGGRERGRA